LETDPNRYLCVQQSDLTYFHGRFDGAPMSQDWTPPAFDLLNRSKKVADFTSWQIGTKAFLVSERARAVLQSLCGDDLEFLPFAQIKRISLYAVNVLRTEDYLDWEFTEFMPGADIPVRAIWRTDLPKPCHHSSRLLAGRALTHRSHSAMRPCSIVFRVSGWPIRVRTVFGKS
jgi:hypothetical protein